MFPIRNRTRLKSGGSMFDRMQERAIADCEKFLAYNPSRREATSIEFSWAGDCYRYRCRYVSDQGTSTFATGYEYYKS
jgi:hypothetical protein